MSGFLIIKQVVVLSETADDIVHIPSRVLVTADDDSCCVPADLASWDLLLGSHTGTVLH